MKLLSFKYLFTKAKESLIRFPLTLFFATLGVVVGIFLVECGDDIGNKLPYINWLLISALAVPLFFCIAIYQEKNNIVSKKLKLLYHLGGVLFLGFVYYSLPSIEDTHNTSIPYIRYGIFNVVVHLMVSFVPYLNTKELNGFWNYNKALFLRLCASVLYSGFIYIGLVLALLAIDNLFHIDVYDELYLEIFITIAGLFNTWFFISGIPKNLKDLEELTEYPKGLKIFTQYVLLSLLTLYLIILYAYGAKIITNWNWPRGWVSYLVSGVSILGFFNVLLMYPYGKLKGNEWMAKFAKLFYYILLPLLILLFIAIYIRIENYGITVRRYSVITLGIWITLVCVYFLFRKDNIKFIPISLAVLLLLTSFGPWGMFFVSERGQVKRLKSILEQNAILVNNKVANEVIWIADSLPKFESENELTNNSILNDSLHNEVKSILDYLDDYHGMKKIRPWFQQDIDDMISVEKNHNRYSWNNEARVYMRTLGLKYNHRYSWSKRYQSYHYKVKTNDVIDVSKYNYYYPFRFYNKNKKKLRTPKNTLNFYRKGDVLYLTTLKDTLLLDVNKVHSEFLKKYGKNDENDIPDEGFTFKMNSERLEVKMKLERINFSFQNDSLFINNINGQLFFNEK